MSMGIIAGVVAVAGTAYSAYSSSQAQKKALNAQQGAIDQQQNLLAGLKYEPIDIAKLQSDATAAAAQNATNSLALERTLQPNVAATREGLSKTVADQLALGGNLSPDVANQVATAARVRGSSSGVGGNAAPITAALTGQTAQSLLQQRMSNSANLLAANPLPTAGLDPGSLASAEIANQNALNQFNIAKAGGTANLINSQAQVTGSQAGAQDQQNAMWANLISGLANKEVSSNTANNSVLGKILGGLKTPSNPATTPLKTDPWNGTDSLPDPSWK